MLKSYSVKHTLTDSLSLRLTGALHNRATVLRSVHGLTWPSLLLGVVLSSLRLGSGPTKVRQVRGVGH